MLLTRITALLPPSLPWLDHLVALALLCLSDLILPIAFPLPIEVGGHWRRATLSWPVQALKTHEWGTGCRIPYSERRGHCAYSPALWQTLCALEWAAVTGGLGAEPDTCMHAGTSSFGTADASCVEVQSQSTCSTRGEWLLPSALTSAHLTGTAGEPLRCSTGQLTPVKAVRGVSSDPHLKSFVPSETCLLAALLCNVTLQCWWPLWFCFLKRSSHIWSWCAFISVLEPYGTLEGKSRVKMGCLAHTWFTWAGVFSAVRYIKAELAFVTSEEVKGAY